MPNPWVPLRRNQLIPSDEVVNEKEQLGKRYYTCIAKYFAQSIFSDRNIGPVVLVAQVSAVELDVVVQYAARCVLICLLFMNPKIQYRLL
jgi:hypothetical protein